MAEDEKNATGPPAPGTPGVASYGTSVVVAPTDTGSAGTQAAGMSTALTVVPPSQGAVVESPWPTLFEKAGRHASTLAMADVAWALTTQHAAEAERRDAADNRKDELIQQLSGQLANERVKSTRLETEKETGASPPLVIFGGALIGLGGILAYTTLVGAAALAGIGVVQMGLGLWRPKGWRR